ncbi:MAG: DUF1684 domain-containing protein [Bacteroidota bacterium]
MKRAAIILVLITLGAIVFYSLSSGSSDEDYKAGIRKERQEKDSFMKNSEESPIEDKNAFTALNYFEPDPKYRVTANLEKIDNKKVILLPTSTNEESNYLEYAWAEFEIDGVKNRLLLLEVMAMGPTRGTLFLAFADETSAKETYGAGRYLELKKMPGAGTMVLDFNKAYNPYCAYTDKFSCPFPPKENVLKVAIRAGEKNYH